MSELSVASFGPDKLNATFVSAKIGDGYGMKRNIREPVSDSKLTSDGLKQLVSMRHQRDAFCVTLENPPRKSGKLIGSTTFPTEAGALSA